MDEEKWRERVMSSEEERRMGKSSCPRSNGEVANLGNTTSGSVLGRSKENRKEPARVAEEREKDSTRGLVGVGSRGEEKAEEVR